MRRGIDKDTSYKPVDINHIRKRKRFKRPIISVNDLDFEKFRDLIKSRLGYDGRKDIIIYNSYGLPSITIGTARE